MAETVEGDLSASDPRSTRYGSYIDTYALDLEYGQSVHITMAAAGFDPFLSLVDPNGETILVDDDGGGGWNARVDLTVSLPGRYQVLAGSMSVAVGPYTLAVEGGVPAPEPSPFSQP